jgi:hypothetical protein
MLEILKKQENIDLVLIGMSSPKSDIFHGMPVQSTGGDCLAYGGEVN